MTLARPEFLWLFSAVAACAFFAVLGAVRRRRAMAAYAHVRVGSGRRIGKSLCFLCGLTLAVLAAAGPQIGSTPAPAAPPVPLRLVIALDASRSMLARDVAPDRLAAAKALLADVLARLPRVEAGLVGFAGRAWLACPVTADRTALALFLDALGPEDAPLGGTNPAAALEACRLALAGAEKGVAIILSDGEATTPAEDADGTWPADWPLLAVAVGGPTPAPVPDGAGGHLRDAAGAPVLSGVDAAGLAGLAARHGGQTYRLAPDTPSPAPAMARLLATLAPSEHAAASAARPVDRTETFLLAALALLLLDLALPAAVQAALAVLLLAALPAGPARAASSAADNVAQGVAAWEAGGHAPALAAFLAARARDPDNPAILYDIGTAYYRLDAFDRAEAAFDRAAAGAPPPLAARARYNQGNAAYRRGDADAAIRCYEAALALDPNDADAKANLDWLRAKKERRPSGGNGRDNGETQRSGQSPGSDESGSATEEGRAPAPRGRDDGAGGPKTEEGPGEPDPTPASGRNGQVDIPVSAREGRKSGERRAGTAGRATDPVLDRIPDLPGLPRTPHYGRPTVEKDW